MVLGRIKSPSISNPCIFQSVPNKEDQKRVKSFNANILLVIYKSRDYSIYVENSRIFAAWSHDQTIWKLDKKSNVQISGVRYSDSDCISNYFFSKREAPKKGDEGKISKSESDAILSENQKPEKTLRKWSDKSKTADEEKSNKKNDTTR